MSDKELRRLSTKYYDAQHALEQGIIKRFPEGTAVRFKRGRGWWYGVSTGRAHQSSLSVRMASGKVHRAWFRDTEHAE